MEHGESSSNSKPMQQKRVGYTLNSQAKK